MIRALVATLAIVAALAAACGSPAGDGAPFSYDPIPYTVTVFQGTPIAISAERDRLSRFRADALSVTVKPAKRVEFERWADSYDFKIGNVRTDQHLDLTFIELLVPPGSVRDALKLVRSQDVVSADLDYVLEVQAEAPRPSEGAPP